MLTRSERDNQVHFGLIVKMAEDTDQRIDSALKDIVNAMNQSKHVNNELKKTILESVSTIRNIFHALKKDIQGKSAETLELQTQVKEVKLQLQAYRHTRATAPVAPSIDRLKTPETYKRDAHHPSGGRKMNSYADIVAGRENKKFKLMIKSKLIHTPDATKELIKSKINPTEMKVGISTFKALKDGRILIEACSKEEIGRIRDSITEKCGTELVAKV